MSLAVEATTTCPNCAATISGAFCATCGQKVGPLNPTLGEFLTELFQELTSFDGKTLQSIGRLLSRPGFLSLEYFAGRRAPYLPPIRLYLLLSVFYFAVAAFFPLSGPTVRCTSCPPEQRAEVERMLRETLVAWAPRIMFVLVPAFAALVALTTRRSGRKYPQVLYFSLHIHAAWFFVAAVASPLSAVPYVKFVSPLIATIYAVRYFFVALRRVFGVSFAGALWRSATVLMVYFAIVLATLVASLLETLIRAS